MANEGKIQIIPSEFKVDWTRWMENIKDWCLSRQIWWGHRIPAFKVIIPNLIDHPDASNPNHWIVARNYKEAIEKT